MKLVIAGSLKQYHEFLAEHPEEVNGKTCKYVDDIRHVLGMRGAAIVLYGAPEMNPLIADYGLGLVITHAMR